MTDKEIQSADTKFQLLPEKWDMESIIGREGLTGEASFGVQLRSSL